MTSLVVACGALTSCASSNDSGAGSGDSGTSLPPAHAPVADPATETPDRTYCAAQSDGGQACRPATADDPTGCARASEHSTDAAPDGSQPYTHDIPQDCVQKGW